MDQSSSSDRSVSVKGGAARPAIAPLWDRDTAWTRYVQGIAEHDQHSLTALYDESSSIVYGLALRVLGSEADAEEVTIDVYNQVWRSAVSYQPTRGSVLAWMATMARTRSIDRLRSRGLRTRSEQPLSSVGDIRAEDTSETATVRRLDAQRASAIFSELPDEQREAITLAYISGMSHSEIAQHLQVPLGTVKTRIRLGMCKLRELLRGLS